MNITFQCIKLPIHLLKFLPAIRRSFGTSPARNFDERPWNHSRMRKKFMQANCRDRKTFSNNYFHVITITAISYVPIILSSNFITKWVHIDWDLQIILTELCVTSAISMLLLLQSNHGILCQTVLKLWNTMLHLKCILNII